LFHWCWQIGLGKCKPSDAPFFNGVDIQWEHGDINSSINAAKEMIKGFGLATPPQSNVAPALNSNHIQGKAIDMQIKWHSQIKVKKKDEKILKISYNVNPDTNEDLIEIGKSYNVIKHRTDMPHWSYNGR
jgi:hypothetical protein